MAGYLVIIFLPNILEEKRRTFFLKCATLYFK